MNSVIDKYKNILKEKRELIIDCRLSPQAKNSEIKEAMGDGALKVRVSSSPEKGKANLELRHLLSQKFEVPLSNVKIIKGSITKFKKVKIIK
jgi:uncharacterized protein (TIGR00251 family)